jgi:cell division protein FtsW
MINASNPNEVHIPALFDRYLLVAIFGLMALGLIMVTSASMVIGEQRHQEAFYFLYRQGIFLLVGLFAMLVIVRIPIGFWQRFGLPLFLLAVLLLIAVLIPGVGRMVNGSRRWLGVGFIGLQVSEFLKLAMILYMADYLVRYEDDVRTRIQGFVKPLILLGLVAALLLLQPDFGATVVVSVTLMAMMFLAGVRLRYFIILFSGMIGAMVMMIMAAPYRMARLTSFLDPWANAFGSGYQLTQSLIAFGRGGVTGVGLGESVQKLFYLPEAYTDFLFAVLAEELGLIGVLVVIGLFALLITRIMLIGRRSQLRGKLYSAYVAYGIAIWFGIQAMVNMGVNSGILPTKGLTLPLLSYGGSSLLIDCIAIGILLRIDHETRLEILGLSQNIRKTGAKQ